MKKSLLIVILTFFSLTFFGQVKTEEFKEIVETELSKDQMWINIKKSIPLIFSDKNYIIEMEDKETGVIIIKWNSKLPVIFSNYSMKNGYLNLSLESSLTIEIKDNKYRYSVPFGVIQVSLNPPTSSDLQFMGETALNLISKDLNLIAEISEKYYLESMTWNLDLTYDRIIYDFTNVGRSEEFYFIKELKETYMQEILNVKNAIYNKIIILDDF